MSESPEFEDRVRKLLQENRGREVWSQSERFVFRFAREGEAATYFAEWCEHVRRESLQLIGCLAGGESVCANSAGKLWIGFCNEDSELDWYDSHLTLEELLQRVDARDEQLEEDLWNKA
jgi:hypothetical protein